MRYFQRGFAALVIVLLAWPFAPPVQAQSGGACPGIGTVTPLGFETITVSSTAIGFTTASISPAGRSASVAVGYVATGAIRYRDDGVDPTAAVGMPIAASTQFQVCGVLAIRQFKMIRQTIDASISVSYYGG
jgi:hypothetical protein